MEVIFDWSYFFTLLIILVLIFLILRLLKKYLLTDSGRRISAFIKRAIVLTTLWYIPFAVLLLGISFIVQNFIWNGLVILLISALFYNEIKNYVSGLILRSNNLIETGTIIITGKFEGEVEKINNFGLLLNMQEGKQYISYSFIEKNGLFVNQWDKDILKQSLFIKMDVGKEKLLDLLFENPLISSKYKPIIKKSNHNDYQKLEFTLEKGISLHTIMEYLKQNNIDTIQSVQNI
ncbi:MAG: hypothetical protein ABFR62_11765 [Bacteroidota bacterium]